MNSTNDTTDTHSKSEIEVRHPRARIFGGLVIASALLLIPAAFVVAIPALGRSIAPLIAVGAILLTFSVEALKAVQPIAYRPIREWIEAHKFGLVFLQKWLVALAAIVSVPVVSGQLSSEPAAEPPSLTCAPDTSQADGGQPALTCTPIKDE